MGQIRADVRVDHVRKAVRAGAVKGLTLAAEHLLAESRKLVPLETGALERSGVATVDAQNLRAAVSYDTPYAVRQHDDLTYGHDSGREAKYLEKPHTHEADTMGRIIANAVKQAMS